MHIRKNIVTVNGIDQERDISYYTFEDLTPENIDKINNNLDSIIILGNCPICGRLVTLNQSPYGHYAWCPVCGLEGPKHFDAYGAAKMFVDHNFTTVAEVKGFSPGRVKEFRLDNFDIRNRHRVEEFARREETK